VHRCPVTQQSPHRSSGVLQMNPKTRAINYSCAYARKCTEISLQTESGERWRTQILQWLCYDHECYQSAWGEDRQFFQFTKISSGLLQIIPDFFKLLQGNFRNTLNYSISYSCYLIQRHFSLFTDINSGQGFLGQRILSS